MFKRMSIGLLLALSSITAQAQHVALEDWWLTTDDFGGLKQSTSAPDFYFAVSKNNSIKNYPGYTYETPEGYRIATTEEAESVFFSTTNGGTSNTYTYFNQGGWQGYSWEGTTRFHFLFSDSLETKAYKHVGNFDHYQVQYTSNISNIAGFVLIKDVPAPFMLSALGLALIGFSKRKKRGIL